MAAYSNKKKVKQTEKPIGRTIAQGGDPEQYYSENPSWNFFYIDKKQWAFTKEHVGDVFFGMRFFQRCKALKVKHGMKYS